MEVAYKTRKLQRVCTDAALASRKYGKRMACLIQQRINELRAAESIEEMVQFRIGRCHALVGSMSGQYALDLVHPFRLLFEPYDDGEQAVLICDIIDYH